MKIMSALQVSSPLTSHKQLNYLYSQQEDESSADEIPISKRKRRSKSAPAVPESPIQDKASKRPRIILKRKFSSAKSWTFHLYMP